MKQDIFNPEYWRDRIKDVDRKWKGELHKAVYLTSLEDWRAIEDRHREILAQHIKPTDSVLDAGCGWGRLVDLLSKKWTGVYLGVDISPEFIAMAKDYHPEKVYIVHDLQRLNGTLYKGELQQFDWAVCISIDKMVERNVGEDTWELILNNLRKIAKKILLLQYDKADEGKIVYGLVDTHYDEIMAGQR